MANVVQTAALAGDAKIALEYLKHRADWTAAQKVEITGSQSISISLALEQAQARVLNREDVIDVEPITTPDLRRALADSAAQTLSATTHAADQVPAR